MTAMTSKIETRMWRHEGTMTQQWKEPPEIA